MKHPKSSVRTREKLRERQGNRCLYCELDFGMVVSRTHGWPFIVLSAQVEHLLPWIYSEDNGIENLGVACQICNDIKGDKVFQNLDEARRYVNGRWVNKGWELWADDIRFLMRPQSSRES